jgi:hypothetical protein
MSYDLYFKSREGAKPSGVADFAAYFKGRQNYHLSDKQAVYQSETTGVYFWFDFDAVESDETPDLLPLSLGVNYYRPHVFGLEAELEVRALVEKFQLQISDPQSHGMGGEEYSAQGFLNGWNYGNEIGYRSILQQGENPLSLPTAVIESCWQWNFQRDDLKKELGDDVFVPRFMFIIHDGAVRPTVVWPDGIPTALPETELLIIPRKSVLPKKFLVLSTQDTVLATRAEVEEVMQRYPLKQAALPYRLLTYSTPPPEIVDFLQGLKPMSGKLDAVTVDKILNAELVEKARSANT